MVFLEFMQINGLTLWDEKTEGFSMSSLDYCSLVTICIFILTITVSLSIPSFPAVPCHSQNVCAVEYSTAMWSQNGKREIVSNFEYKKSVESSSLIMKSTYHQSDIQVIHFDGYDIWTLDSFAMYNTTDTDSVKIQIQSYFDLIGGSQSMFKYEGVENCPNMNSEFCDKWKLISGTITSNIFSFNNTNPSDLFAMEVKVNDQNAQLYIFKWIHTKLQENERNIHTEKSHHHKELLESRRQHHSNQLFVITSEMVEFPSWWSKAMKEVHMLGFDGGPSVYIDEKTSIWVFSDSTLNKSVCNRPIYAQGLSNSLMVVKHEDGPSKNVTDAYYTPKDPNLNNCAEMFLPVSIKRWSPPFSDRYWPGGGLVGSNGVVYVSYYTSSFSTNHSGTGAYIATANVKDLSNFDISNKNKFPVFGNALEKNDDDDYYYFLPGSNPETWHYLSVGRVSKNNKEIMDPEAYEINYGVSEESGEFLYGKFSDGYVFEDGIPLIDLIALNPQQSVRFNKYLKKYVLLTVSPSILYVQISDDLERWSLPLPVYVNKWYKDECNVYCPFFHPELNEDDDSVVYLTLSVGASNDCPVYINELVKVTISV